MRTGDQTRNTQSLQKTAGEASQSMGLWRKSFHLFLGAFLGFAASSHAVDIKVSTADAIQTAIDQCPDNDASGCRIILTAPSYTLSNSLVIHNKSNVTITSSTTSRRPQLLFQDRGNLAGPAFKDANGGDSSKYQVAGWKHWPYVASDAVGGAKNTTNPFSTSGIQRNGTILIQGSHNIILDGITVNGGGIAAWGSPGVWGSGGTFYGNAGINLYLSGNVTVRNCEIKNCFTAFYVMNRNLGGALAHKNPGDLDAANLAPGSRYGEMGNHLIEKNLIHDDVWAVFQESNYDLGSTWRFNRMWNLHNNTDTLANWVAKKTTVYSSSYTTATVAENSDAANHCGGFMYMKDVVAVPDKIYHNTFWRVTSLFYFGGWRGGSQHYFYNNLVLQPWLDYNADTTSYLTGNFASNSAGISSSNNLTKKMGAFMYANTFAYFPVIPLLNQAGDATKATCVGDKDSCQKIRDDLRNKVWPKARLQFQTQKVQGTSVMIGSQNTYVQPLTDLYYIDGLQYQPDQRMFIFQNDWKLSSPSTSDISKKAYSATVEAGNNGKDAGVKATFSYSGYDSNAIKARFGAHGALLDSLGLAALPWWSDTVGIIKTMASQDVASHGNCYIKSVPAVYNSAASNFLAPTWTDAGVDSCILNKVWNPATGTVSTSTSQVAQGAIQPNGSIGVDMLQIDDNTPALIVGKLATVSFDLSSTVSNVSNLKVIYAKFIPTVSDADDASYTTASSQDINIALIQGTLAIGGNTLNIQLPAEAGSYSRIELMVSGQTADGKTIYSNIGLWLIRKSTYSFAVSFHKDKFDVKDTVDTVRAGDPVWMRVQPMLRTAMHSAVLCTLTNSKGKDSVTTCSIDTVTQTAYTKINGTLNTFSIRATRMYDAKGDLIPSSGLYKGGAYIPSTGIQDSSNANVWWTQVSFTKSGLAAPVMTALANGDTSKVFTGGGSIYVRPNVPYVAQLSSPGSYSLTDTVGTTIPYNTKTKVTLNVEDKYGNLVDTATTVTLNIQPNMTTQFGALHTVVGDQLAAKSASISVPATGIGQSFILSKEQADSTQHFVLQSWLGADASAATGTVYDSAWVRVGKVPLQLAWVYKGTTTPVTGIDTLVKSPTPITLLVTDGDGKPLADTVSVILSSSKIKLHFALDTAATTYLDTLRVFNGVANLLVSSDYQDSLDTIIATPVVGDAEASIYPVTFHLPPVPPYPVVDSVLLTDADCDGVADLLQIGLGASAGGTASVLDTTKTRVHALRVVVGKDTTAFDSTSWNFVTGSTSQLTLKIDSTLGRAISSNGGRLSLQYTLHRLPLADTVVWGSDSNGVSISDRIAPRILSAKVIENFSNSKDTFEVRFSKAITYSGSSWPFTTMGSTLKNTSTIVVDAFDALSDATLPYTYRFVVEGNRSNGVASPSVIDYTDALKIAPDAALVDASGNHGVDCSPLVTLQKISRLPSIVGGYITSTDGTGTANSVTVVFARALLSTEHIDSISVEFGNNTHLPMAVTATEVGTSGTTWSMALSNPFTITRGSANDFYGANVTVYGTKDGGLASSQGLVADSVPVVFGPIGGAYVRMAFGSADTTSDTLYLTLSEPIHAVSQIDGILRHDSTIGTKSIVLASTDSLVWKVVLAAGAVNGGDTVEMGSSIVGNDGVHPATGANASKAVVIGGDRAPIFAYYTDSLGLGTASQLNLVFNRKLLHGQTFRVLWPDTDGVNFIADTVEVDSATSANMLQNAAGSYVLTLKGLSFKKGVTGASSMMSGTMTPIFFGADTQFNSNRKAFEERFVIADSVPPMLLDDTLRYSTDSLNPARDTLRLFFSEPVYLKNGTYSEGSLTLLVKDSSAGYTVRNLNAQTLFINPDAMTGYVVFNDFGDSALAAGDSVRIAKLSDIIDAKGNVVGDLSPYVRVHFAVRPPVKMVIGYVLPGGGTEYLLSPTPVSQVSPLASSGSNVAILGIDRDTSYVSLLSNSAADWNPTWSDLKGTIGISTPCDTGNLGKHAVLSIYIYDKYGTFVGKSSADLSASLFTEHPLLFKSSNKFNLVALWDGRSQKGSAVADGVYAVRVLLIRDITLPDGSIQKKMEWNIIKHVGIKHK